MVSDVASSLGFRNPTQHLSVERTIELERSGAGLVSDRSPYTTGGGASSCLVFFARSSSLTVMRILPCLFSPGHSCLLRRFDDKVAPQPHNLFGVASTNSQLPVLSSISCRWAFWLNFFFRQEYIASNFLDSQSSDVPSSSPIRLISTWSLER